MNRPTDAGLQAQVDNQLLEQGAFAPLDLLLDSGRLQYGDYESWRRGEIDYLDTVLMGNRERIRAQLEQAAAYARSIGLQEEQQDFHLWSAVGGAEKWLRVSADGPFHRLVCGRYSPTQDAPQLDLFFDNPVVAITNSLTRALAGRDRVEAQRQLDQLYQKAPNHADLAAFDALLEALRHLGEPVVDARDELDFLQRVAPSARALLGAQARDLLTPLWRQLGAALQERSFDKERPLLHASYVLGQAQDWAGVSAAVLREPDWQRHATLCLRLAESGYRRQDRTQALHAWCQLCWHAPAQAEELLDRHRQPDPGINALWQRFVDAAEDNEEPLQTGDFPAWLLLVEPGLAHQLPAAIAGGESTGETGFHLVHRWTTARRAGDADGEVALRRQMQEQYPPLFRCLLKNAKAAEYRR